MFKMILYFMSSLQNKEVRRRPKEASIRSIKNTQ